MLDLDKSDSSLRSFSVPLDDFKMKPFLKCFSKQSFKFKGHAIFAFPVYRMFNGFFLLSRVNKCYICLNFTILEF